MTVFSEGPNSPVFVCNPDASKDVRMRWMNQNISTLVTIAEEADATIPLVAHTSKYVSTIEDVTTHCDKLIEAIGFDGSQLMTEEDRPRLTTEIEGDGFKILTFVFVTALPIKKG